MAYGELEDLEVFRLAEWYCDRIYSLVHMWNGFDTHTVGDQLVRAADSVGANIAESYGRFHYAERIHFLHYARGSAYETIFWLRRAQQRNLLAAETVAKATSAYSSLIISLNSYIRMLRTRKVLPTKKVARTKVLAESSEPYYTPVELPMGDPF